jgi:hypothetical protein
VACLAIAQALWTAPVDARDWHVNLSHPEATDPPADQAPDPRAGTADRPLKSINAAAAVAQPGDTVLVHPGIYRECVRPVRGGLPGKPVMYCGVNDPTVASPTDCAVVSGAEPWTPEWRSTDAALRIYAATPNPDLFPEGNPFLRVAHPKRGGGRHGQLFIDGAIMKEVASQEELRNTPAAWFMAGTNSTMFVHFPSCPQDCRLAGVGHSAVLRSPADPLARGGRLAGARTARWRASRPRTLAPRRDE